jgi:glucose-6-phosphate 1-dehydrogenase
VITVDNERADSMVVFGATGDLAKLQTYPALVNLVERGVLDFPVIGVGHHDRPPEELRAYARASLQRHGIDPRSRSAEKMVSLLDYVAGDLDDDTTYQAISDRLGARRRTLFYLEVPPGLFGRIAEGIASAGRHRDSRIMVEKPFGTDLASARELSAVMHKVFPEDAIFRVDHWLALESLENILYTRFANSILDPLLNERYVEHIEITMAEDFGVADRGAFYEETGAIRDVLQNHLLQLLVSILADEPSHGVRTWRSERTRAMQELRPLRPHEVVRGQYAGYRDVDGAAATSTVETFVAVRLASDSARWSGVPIDIRAGKCLPVTATELTIRFRPPARDVCGIENFGQMNELRFRVRPDTAMTLTLAGKRPGIAAQAQTEELNFAQQPGLDPRPYDRLIGAALDGDDFYFAREDSIDAAWKVVDPILGDAVPVHSYQPGTWGPAEADGLLPDGTAWHNPSTQ